jgi:hypothetical protein
MGATRAKWRGNQLAFYDSATHETVLPLSPFYWIDDFVTDAKIKAAGIPGWTVVDTSAAGNSTPVQVADISCGAFSCLLDGGQDEEEESGLHWNNQREFNLDKAPIIEFRVKASVLPTAISELYFGVAGDYVKGTLVAADQGPLIHAFFVMDGSGIVTVHTDDNGGEDNNAVATGVTVLATAYHVYRIDFTDVANVRFYIDGADVGGAGLSMANGANVMVQPYIMCYKSAGVGVGTLEIDYVRVWQATR